MATFPTSTDDDGTGTTGTIIDQAYMHAVRDYIGTTWTNVTYSAGNFTANGSMTWTVASGDQQVYRWIEIGKTMFVSFYLINTTVGGTPSTELRIAVPNGRTIAASTTAGSYTVLDNGTQRAALWVANGSTTYIALTVNFGQNWTASTDNTSMAGTAIFEIS